MNSPKLNHKSRTIRTNRSIRRAREKEKRKTIIHLIGKGKTNKRTKRNLEKIFSFIGNKKQFTGPQIQKNKKLKSSVLYDLLDTLTNRGIITVVGAVKSAGRGQTKIYALTTAGKIIASYFNDDTKLLTSTLKEISEKEPNFLKRFFIEAFTENYPTRYMRKVLEEAIHKAKRLEKGLNIDDFISELTQEAFFLIPFIKEEEEERKKELELIFKKNVELIEKSEHRDLIFQYFKMQMESRWLYTLQKQKLKKYAESLKENPQCLHIPCKNPNCYNTTIIDNLQKLSITHYCEKCQRKMAKAKTFRRN